MRKNIKTINEEIDRIKSLFTEERLFGNLVEEEDPFSKKSARKSKKSQTKDDKDIAKKKEKRDSDTKKDKRQYRRALSKFCKKEVGKLSCSFKLSIS